MFEELSELLFGPWGFAIALGVVLLNTKAGRETSRKTTKELLKGGLVVGDAMKELGSRIQESVSDIVSEAREEADGSKLAREKSSHIKGEGIHAEAGRHRPV